MAWVIPDYFHEWQTKPKESLSHLFLVAAIALLVSGVVMICYGASELKKYQEELEEALELDKFRKAEDVCKNDIMRTALLTETPQQHFSTGKKTNTIVPIDAPDTLPLLPLEAKTGNGKKGHYGQNKQTGKKKP